MPAFGLIFHPSVCTEAQLPLSTPTGKAVIIVDDEKSSGDLRSQLRTDNLDRRVLPFSHP